MKGRGVGAAKDSRARGADEVAVQAGGERQACGSGSVWCWQFTPARQLGGTAGISGGCPGSEAVLAGTKAGVALWELELPAQPPGVATRSKAAPAAAAAAAVVAAAPTAPAAAIAAATAAAPLVATAGDEGGGGSRGIVKAGIRRVVQRPLREAGTAAAPPAAALALGLLVAVGEAAALLVPREATRATAAAATPACLSELPAAEAAATAAILLALALALALAVAAAALAVAGSAGGARRSLLRH